MGVAAAGIVRLLSICRMVRSLCALANLAVERVVPSFVAGLDLDFCIDIAIRFTLASCRRGLDRLGGLGWNFIRLLRRFRTGAGDLVLGSNVRLIVYSGACLVGRGAPPRLGYWIVEPSAVGDLFMAEEFGRLSSLDGRCDMLGDLDGIAYRVACLAATASVGWNLRFSVCSTLRLMGGLVWLFCLSSFVRGLFRA